MARMTKLGLVTALSLFTMVPAVKAAPISACGNIDVEADASCNLDATASCAGNCQLPSCSASFYASCSGGCQATLPSCEASCSGSCQTSCTANANFNCNADCNATCSGKCSATCQSKCQSDSTHTDCQAQCEGTCQATCQGECSASCSGNASVDCSGKCSASCQGSCNGQARLDCQWACKPPQAYIDCTNNCHIACQGQGGLFCNGQFIDYGNNLDNCIHAIEAAIPIKVTGYANSSGSCSGNTCQGEANAGASVSCALVRLGQKKGMAGSLIILGAAGLVAGVRRRRRH